MDFEKFRATNIVKFENIKDNHSINFISKKFPSEKNFEFVRACLNDYFYYKLLKKGKKIDENQYQCYHSFSSKFHVEKLESLSNKIKNYDNIMLSKKLLEIREILDKTEFRQVVGKAKRSVVEKSYNFEIMKIFPNPSKFDKFVFSFSKKSFEIVNISKELIKVDIDQFLEVYSSVFSCDFSNLKTFKCKNIIITNFCTRFDKIVLDNSYICCDTRSRYIVFNNCNDMESLEYSILSVSKEFYKSFIKIKNSKICCVLKNSRYEIIYKNCIFNYDNIEKSNKRIISECIWSLKDYNITSKKSLDILEILVSLKDLKIEKDFDDNLFDDLEI